MLPISIARPRSTPIQLGLSPRPLGFVVTRSIFTRSALPKQPVALCLRSSWDRWGSIAYPPFFPFLSKEQSTLALRAQEGSNAPDI